MTILQIFLLRYTKEKALMQQLFQPNFAEQITGDNGCGDDVDIIATIKHVVK